MTQERTESLYLHGTDPDEQNRLARLNNLLNEQSLREMALRLGDRVLDVGCGLGQLTGMKRDGQEKSQLGKIICPQIHPRFRYLHTYS